MPKRPRVVLSLLGLQLDAGRGAGRWEKWRPTIALTQFEDLLVDRLELLYDPGHRELADIVVADIAQVSPDTRVVLHPVGFRDPWDFEDVYSTLFDFCERYPFDSEREDYLAHITTGTHVAQICLFLLTESRNLPARLLQTAPGRGAERGGPGSYAVIDLDLSKYDRLASRFARARQTGQSLLKSGIDTKNRAFNELSARIEAVAVGSRAPLLLSGPTGAGKSRLARRIYELRKSRRQVSGDFAEVNCATLRGDMAMSTLFGHKKGAFTGAAADRAGLLKRAHQGVLFLDELGELGLDEQAMLLRAIEEKSFYPLGSDRAESSDFQLLCGTNRDIEAQIARGTFREDLYARINVWMFRLPALHERPEDIAPNLDYELDEASRALGQRVTLSREARSVFLAFAERWKWPGNFRDLNAIVTRMSTLAHGGRITEDIVREQIEELRVRGGHADAAGARGGPSLVERVLGVERARRLDRFDRVQLEDVLVVCANARTMSDAGRELFAASRGERTSVNDADRLRKYLTRFEVDFRAIPRDRA